MSKLKHLKGPPNYLTLQCSDTPASPYPPDVSYCRRANSRSVHHGVGFTWSCACWGRPTHMKITHVHVNLKCNWKQNSADGKADMVPETPWAELGPQETAWSSWRMG